MRTFILIYDVIKTEDFTFKCHYRLYSDNKDLITQGDYVYVMRKHRRVIPAVLKSRISTGIWMSLHNKKFVDMRSDRYTSNCLVTNEVIKGEIDSCFKNFKEEPLVKTFTKKVEVADDNPRIYRVVLINDNYTIVKAENKYLTREQAKEELFNKQLEEA